MIPPNIQKWIAALRSGKYKQTTDHLRTDEGFCCLGVGCDISGLGKWKIEHHYEDMNVYSYDIVDSHDKGLDVLPPTVMEWLGVRDNIVRYDKSSKWKRDLPNLNDNIGVDFNKIADVIEKNWQTMVTQEVREEYGLEQDTP